MYITDYPQEVYKDFVYVLEGSRIKSKELIANGYPQWAAFANAILGDSKALDWLFLNQFYIYGILANAINDEESALKYLINHYDRLLLNFCQATKKDLTAIEWLKYNNYLLFVLLAQKINSAMEVRIKEETFWYRLKW